MAYGLTSGGYKVEQIGITSLGQRIVAPTESDDDVRAKREAVMKPKIMRAFYERYNNAKFPDDKIAGNVLVSLGLPKDRIQSAVRILKENAEYAGILKQVAGSTYIDLPVATNNSVSTAATVSPQEESEIPTFSTINSVAPASEANGFTKAANSFHSPSLHIDIQIHISPEASAEQIEKIFESMAKHLYKRTDL